MSHSFPPAPGRFDLMALAPSPNPRAARLCRWRLGETSAGLGEGTGRSGSAMSWGLALGREGGREKQCTEAIRCMPDPSKELSPLHFQPRFQYQIRAFRAQPTSPGQSHSPLAAQMSDPSVTQILSRCPGPQEDSVSIGSSPPALHMVSRPGGQRQLSSR